VQYGGDCDIIYSGSVADEDYGGIWAYAAEYAWHNERGLFWGGRGDRTGTDPPTGTLGGKLWIGVALPPGQTAAQPVEVSTQLRHGDHDIQVMHLERADVPIDLDKQALEDPSIWTCVQVTKSVIEKIRAVVAGLDKDHNGYMDKAEVRKFIGQLRNQNPADVDEGLVEELYRIVEPIPEEMAEDLNSIAGKLGDGRSWSHPQMSTQELVEHVLAHMDDEDLGGPGNYVSHSLNSAGKEVLYEESQINEMYHLLTWQDEDDDVSAEAEHLREEDWIPEQSFDDDRDYDGFDEGEHWDDLYEWEERTKDDDVNPQSLFGDAVDDGASEAEKAAAEALAREAMERQRQLEQERIEAERLADQEEQRMLRRAAEEAEARRQEELRRRQVEQERKRAAEKKRYEEEMDRILREREARERREADDKARAEAAHQAQLKVEAERRAAERAAQARAEEEWKKKQTAADKQRRVSAVGPVEIADPNVKRIVERARRAGGKFEDPDFGSEVFCNAWPAGVVQSWNSAGIHWERPDDYAGQSIPQLWEGDPIADDACQGVAGDCWFVSAMAMVAAKAPHVIKQRFVLAEPELGLYVISFFKEARWQEVCIDDRLLCHGQYISPHLCFTHNEKNKKVVWASLMEKAYAKLHKGYAPIESGSTAYGIRDLTGAVTTFIPRDSLRSQDDWLKLHTHYNHVGKMLMTAVSTHAGGSNDADVVEGEIHTGHAYAVLGYQQVGRDVLCCVRNPWGNDKEWTGEWSDRDTSKWTESMQRQLNYSPGADGAFWMTYRDMFRIFLDDFDLNELYPKDWHRSVVQGEWNSTTAGGCQGSGFEMNTQYMLEIPAPPMEGMSLQGCICLSQEDVRYTGRRNNQRTPNGLNQIGFTLWRPYKKGRNGRVKPYGSLETGFDSGIYANARERSMDLEPVTPGKYVVVPTCFSQGDMGKFSLTLWTNYPCSLREI